MNDIRRTILWVIFGFSMVLLWDKWQIHNGNQALFFPSQARTSAPAPTRAPSTATDAAVPLSSAGAVVAAADVNQVPSAGAAAPTSERVNIRTDVLDLLLDTQGGSIVKATLPAFKALDNSGTSFVLLDYSADRTYMAQTGLSGAKLGEFPSHQTPMTIVTPQRSLQDGKDTLVVRLESEVVGGLMLAKTYTFQRGSYTVQVQHEVHNRGSQAKTPSLYFQITRDGNELPGSSMFASTFTGPAIYTEAKKYQKIAFKDIEKNKVDIEASANNGYIAMVQHYFATVWLLADGVQRELFARKIDTNLYAVGMLTPLASIAPGSSSVFESTLFVGPQVETALEALAPGLELVKDYGYFKILAKPLYWLLTFLHGFLGNWGWSIVALVVLLKAAFYWLNAKAYASMAKMKAVTPRITEMRERLKDKPQEMQQAMMKIYREEKINPMGGCFPIVIQIPVFISLYWVLLSSVEMRGAPWVLWIHDLSSPDPFFILPLVMTATSLLQTWLNPTPPDPMQAKLMWIMPMMFSVMFFFFPAGLVLYWVTNNILSIAQQWFINKRLGVLHKPTNPLKLFMK